MYWVPPAAMPSANVVYPWVQNSHSSGTAIRLQSHDIDGCPIPNDQRRGRVPAGQSPSASACPLRRRGLVLLVTGDLKHAVESQFIRLAAWSNKAAANMPLWTVLDVAARRAATHRRLSAGRVGRTAAAPASPRRSPEVARPPPGPGRTSSGCSAWTGLTDANAAAPYAAGAHWEQQPAPSALRSLCATQ
jgi:hypothetical protein